MKNKCEYCRYDIDGFGHSLANISQDDISIMKVGNGFKLSIVIKRDYNGKLIGSEAVTKAIKFCPMCGRKLSED